MKCPNGHESPTEGTYCPVCGSPLVAGSAQEVGPRGRRRPVLPIAILVGVALALAAGLLAITTHQRHVQRDHSYVAKIRAIAPGIESDDDIKSSAETTCLVVESSGPQKAAELFLWTSVMQAQGENLSSAEGEQQNQTNVQRLLLEVEWKCPASYQDFDAAVFDPALGQLALSDFQ